MSFNPERDDPRRGNLPPQMRLFLDVQRTYRQKLDALRQSDPKLVELDTMDMEPLSAPTALLTADQITVKGMNGFEDGVEQLAGTIEIEVSLSKDGSPYDPLLEQQNVPANEPVIVVGPEIPPCFTDADQVLMAMEDPEYVFPRVVLSDEDCMDLERILSLPLPVITDPGQYAL